MKKLKGEYEIVKSVVEQLAKIDLTAKSRKNNLPYKRYVYYQLCKDFDQGDFRITYCAMAINHKHHSALHGLKRFEDYKNQTFFKPMIELYNICTKQLRVELNLTPEYIYEELLKVKKRVDYLVLELAKNEEVEYEVIG